jgi:hypothetical protein
MAKGCAVAVAAATAVLLAAAAWLPSADAHAVMIDPKSRPWYDYLERYNYNPHAVFAGGKPQAAGVEEGCLAARVPGGSPGRPPIRRGAAVQHKGALARARATMCTYILNRL